MMSKKSLTLWLVRHAEREDNVNTNWQKTKNPFELHSDNTPISERGYKQCEELRTRFADIHVDHIFSSPFDRTVDTSTRLLGNKQIPIKVEPGFCEVLYMCEDPPGFEDVNILQKRYPLVDIEYKPIFTNPMPKEESGDSACKLRVEKTLNAILDKYKGSLVIVSHAAVISALHRILVNNWAYVGQATVSKFTRDESNSRSKFVMELSGDTSHLSDKTNLRQY